MAPSNNANAIVAMAPAELVISCHRGRRNEMAICHVRTGRKAQIRQSSSRENSIGTKFIPALSDRFFYDRTFGIK